MRQPPPGWTEERVREATKDLQMLFGLPPFDGPNNVCRDDAYFMRYIEMHYNVSIAELCQLTGVKRP